MIMQYKVIGTETGKLICTGRHSDCIRTINQKISRWSKSSAHLEPLQILPIDEEYIQVIDEYIEILQTEQKKHMKTAGKSPAKTSK